MTIDVQAIDLGNPDGIFGKALTAITDDHWRHVRASLTPTFSAQKLKLVRHRTLILIIIVIQLVAKRIFTVAISCIAVPEANNKMCRSTRQPPAGNLRKKPGIWSKRVSRWISEWNIKLQYMLLHCIIDKGNYGTIWNATTINTILHVSSIIMGWSSEWASPAVTAAVRRQVCQLFHHGCDRLHDLRYWARLSERSRQHIRQNEQRSA